MPDKSPAAEDYIACVDRIVSKGAPSEETVAEIQHTLSSALESPGWLPERCRRPAADCYARHLLHQDARGRFSIVVMVWERGQSTPIHDHGGVWCVEGVYEGKIRVNRYDLDAPMTGGFARFHSFDIVEAGTGSTGSLIPPVDYHTIGNPFDQLAVTVHTYGGDMKNCHIYLPRPDGSFEVHTKELTYTSRPGAPAPGVSARP